MQLVGEIAGALAPGRDLAVAVRVPALPLVGGVDRRELGVFLSRIVRVLPAPTRVALTCSRWSRNP